MASNNQTITLLQRLSHRPGVQRTVILSRKNGAIIESFGYDSNEDLAAPADDSTSSREAQQKRLERDAILVFGHVQSAMDLVTGLSEVPDDDLKLLRLRTKRHEFMIVPGMARRGYRRLC